jgi:hypothetical protein
MKKQFRDFESARKFVQKLGLKNRKEWQEYYKSGKKPEDIPANPNRDYKKDFKGLGDFLGTGIVSTQDRTYRSFESARKFVQKLGLKNRKEWQEYYKSGKKPEDIPGNPNLVYKNKGWESMGNWLGTGRVANHEITFLSFTEAREFVVSLKLKNRDKWHEYCKSGNKPDNIPQKVERTYKKEWRDWGYFLGTGNIQPQNRTYRPFNEAREFVRSLGLKNWEEWFEYCKSDNKPDDIPSAPWRIYKEWNEKSN